MSKIFSILLLCFLYVLKSTNADDGPQLPPEGFSFGGIPYGSMSGNVAEYYRMKEAEAANLYSHNIPFQYVAQPAVHYPNYYKVHY